MPHAEDFPELVSELAEVPARTNPLGVKGAGESVGRSRKSAA